MRKIILAAVFAWMASVVWAWSLFSSAPDYKIRDEVEFTRRGSMNKDDYVVTDVYPALPCYALVENASTSLVDRAVNRYDLERDTTFSCRQHRRNGAWTHIVRNVASSSFLRLRTPRRRRCASMAY